VFFTLLGSKVCHRA